MQSREFGQRIILTFFLHEHVKVEKPIRQRERYGDARFLRPWDTTVRFSDDMIVSGWSSLRLAVDPDSVEHLWPQVGQSRCTRHHRRDSGS